MIRRHTISFRHAFEGVFYAFRTQPNFRVHLVAALIVTLLGRYVRLTSVEWLFLVFTFMWVITTEMINTSLEAIVDLVSPERQPTAKAAKDTAAGMVLLSAIGAIIIGLIIFLPKLWRSF